MLLSYKDFKTRLDFTFETENTYYISFNENLNRVLLFDDNGFRGFYTSLGTLLTEFLKHRIGGYAYFTTIENIHYLVNTRKIIEYVWVDDETYITFDNQMFLRIGNGQSYNAIKKTIDLGYENTEGQPIHTSSPSDS